MLETIHIAQGIMRNFDGNVQTHVIGARRDLREAQKLGAEWVKDHTEFVKSTGQKIHVSYEICSRVLK